MAPTTILVDGVASDTISVLDRGLAFGDGVFRTLAVRRGRPLNWAWHLRRLRADCETLRLPMPDEATLLQELGRVAAGDAAAKIVLTRGVGTRGYAIGESRPTRVVAAFALPDGAARARDGVRVRRCDLLLSAQPRLAGAKTLNRLENVLARSEWSDAAIGEGLLGDAAGHVVEGTMSNLFLVTSGRLVTADLSRCGVVGAQRERIRELLPVEVREVRWEELEAAEEVFLTNSLIGAWPVVAMDERRWPVGALTRRVQALIEEADALD